MSRHRFNRRWLIYILPLLAIVFVFYSTSIYLLDIQNDNLLPFSSTRDSSIDTRESLHPIIDQINLTVLPMNHTIKDTRLTRPTNNHLQNWRRLVYDKLDIYNFKHIHTALLLIHSFLSLTRITSKHISVIALPIGGHAPPKL